MKKIIAAALGFLGFIIIAGSAGSFDLNSITFTQCIYQMLAGGLCMLVAALMSRNETY